MILEVDMKTTRAISAPGRRALAVLLLVGSTLLAGCSQEFTGIDDVYVPTRPEERFPIEVVEKPVKLTVSAASGKLGPAESDQIIGLAWQAKTRAITGVTVAYPAGSRHGRKVAAEVAALVAQQGVPRARIHTAAYNGKSDSVTMAFVVRVASTKECGDWSHNLANTYKNELFPNMGCAMQNNVAAMVSNPDDLLAPRASPPVRSAARDPAMDNYLSNDWTEPVVTFGDTLNDN